MAHLTCGHDRRVLVVDSGRVVHRSDGGPCPTNPEEPLLQLNGEKLSPAQVLNNERTNRDIGYTLEHGESRYPRVGRDPNY